MMMTRSGALVPRWIASTSMKAVEVGTRVPVKFSDGVSMVRQLPQPALISVKRLFTQACAAPMPRVVELLPERL